MTTKIQIQRSLTYPNGAVSKCLSSGSVNAENSNNFASLCRLHTRYVRMHIMQWLYNFYLNIFHFIGVHANEAWHLRVLTSFIGSIEAA